METDNAPSSPDFVPVPVRARHDGWTPERQVAFIEALAETACVVQAAAAVGLSATAAYNLRRRPEAQAFRLAWDAALDFGVRRLGDAALSRAVHGIARPIFYQGEQIGERRHFDERLTQFILRRRDPLRFGDWRDRREPVQHFDGPALLLQRMLALAEEAAYSGSEGGTPAPPDPALLASAFGIDPRELEEEAQGGEEDDDSEEFWRNYAKRDPGVP